MTQADYARHRNVSREAVRKAVASGRIPTFERNGKKWVDCEAADAAWTRNTDPDQQARAAGTAAAQRGASLIDAKTRESVARAARLELELSHKAGDLISRSAVESALSVRLIASSEHLLSIADRCAAVFAVERDANVIHRRLSDEIRTAMAHIAKPLPTEVR